MNPIKPATITIVAGAARKIANVKLPQESLFTLYLNDTEILTFMATPEKLPELAAGFLLSAGVIKKGADIKSILVKEDDGLIWVEADVNAEFVNKLLNRRFLTSGCGGGSMLEDPLNALSLKPVNSKLAISAGEASDIMAALLQQAKLYKQSGGLHGAALFQTGKIIYLAEDIGRHNAVDKVIGAALLQKIKTKDKILATTGRISSEMLIKAARAGIPLVLSRTAPTELAVRLAQKLNITVTGYVRPESLNIYSHDQRIK